MTLNFCAMLILYCNHALLARQFRSEVDTPGQHSGRGSARGRGAITVKDTKTTRPGDKEAGTAIAGSRQVELAERAHVDDELPDEGESSPGVEA
jgi:hypothetical protein